jgi:hypothetical protein
MRRSSDTQVWRSTANAGASADTQAIAYLTIGSRLVAGILPCQFCGAINAKRPRQYDGAVCTTSDNAAWIGMRITSDILDRYENSYSYL